MNYTYSQLKGLNLLLLNITHEAVLGFNRFGETVFANNAASRLTGWTDKELTGKRAHDIVGCDCDSRSGLLKPDDVINKVLQDGQTRRYSQWTLWRKDGTDFQVQLSCTAWLEDKKIIGALLFFRDISASIIQEQKLNSALIEIQRLRNLQGDQIDKPGDFDTNDGCTPELIGEHHKIKQVLNEVKQVATTCATVLIHGETGTGKELIARMIHRQSNRSSQPLIKLNCGAIPRNLVESELFGHEKGAFTGALHARAGRFEMAHKGTLFLDEVAELPMDTQIKLLRVIQEQEFERIGGNKPLKVDVRIIAASHKDLSALCRSGLFRYDLYYRLNVFPMWIPPIRERISDIPLIISYTLKKLENKLNKTLKELTPESMHKMLAYPWPGNIREIQNVLERAAILTLSPNIKINDEFIAPELANNSGVISHPNKVVDSVGKNNLTSLAEVEKQHIEETLKALNGRISGKLGAATILKIHPNTLRSKMERLGISTSNTPTK
ncbi:sigma-54 interaction domain-containing protein [Planctobacterium marinum]|uniref:sigma-54 interaction domain-containing protein n=1 Tax=Planctobacterium marinum TaxID=1631968 RepID=UPI001E3DB225|nr:sigma 54-interacting transcriptional regulator [Planctobacterium marinum]MCC2604702.1 sigma 54-interacting transcriptional regulator [Planctobacterium marinum]